MRAGVIYSPRRSFEYEVPLSTGFQVVVMGDVRKGAALLQVQLVTRATRAIEKVLFPGCRLGWNVPEKTAKRWCLIAASPLRFSPRRIPAAAHTAVLRVLSYGVWGIPRKEAAAGNPQLGDLETWCLIQARPDEKSTGLWVHSVWLSCKTALLDLEMVVPSPGNLALQVKGGLICWPILPRSLSSATVQPWDTRLLSLQGCDTSPGYRGLWGISLGLLFFKFNFILCWNRVYFQCCVCVVYTAT